MSATAEAKRRPALLGELPERLHHHAYVVRDQERNRQFFEDLLGIPLVATWCEDDPPSDAGARGGDVPHVLRRWPMAARWRSSRLPIRISISW